MNIRQKIMLRDTMLAAGTAASLFTGVDYLLNTRRDLAEDNTSDQVLNEQAKATQRKALSMLEEEGIIGEAHTYPTTQDEIVFIDTNSFVGQGTYLPMPYEGTQAEYQGVMAFRPYGVSGIANGRNCLIVDGNPKTEPLVRGC